MFWMVRTTALGIFKGTIFNNEQLDQIKDMYLVFKMCL